VKAKIPDQAEWSPHTQQAHADGSPPSS